MSARNPAGGLESADGAPEVSDATRQGTGAGDLAGAGDLTGTGDLVGTGERPWGPRIAALLFLAAGVAVLGWAFAIPKAGIEQDVGPRAFPLLVGAGLCVSAVVAVVQAFRGTDPAQTEQAREEARLTEWRPVAALLALLVCYLFALAPCGYWQSTAVLFTLVARVLGSRRTLRDALIGLVLALAVYFLFDRLLGIHLPPGIVRLAF
ncbi:tripartite tricarboxylate transporter TctB family protein [Streptomyces milbemycinicus]|uniref:Tripartite tricarboxylate transporter TctB family protein n=1 Tax=Streptomyces milbemycinicus TaxID=476552 RepID=A0ABW8M2N0_9ACTN